MKKAKRIAVFTSLGCAVLGIVLMISGIAVSGFQIESWFTDNRERRTVEITQDFENVNIDTAVDNIRIIPAESDTAFVEFYEGEKNRYDVQVINNTLIVRFRAERPWYAFVSFGNVSTHDISVFLPAKVYNKVSVKTNVGNIHLSDSFQIGDLNVETNIGNIDIPESVSSDGHTNAQTNIGNITIKKVES